MLTAYTLRAMRNGSLDTSALVELAQTEAARGRRLAEMPPILGRSLLGPYLLGARFLMRGGDPAAAPEPFPLDDVTAAFEDGPTSSEQILHPEKYWDETLRDAPVPVRLDDLDRALGRKWKRIGDGVLGELGLAVLVGSDRPMGPDGFQRSSETWTHPAAAGWGGDRWAIWTRRGRDLVVLRTIWDSDEDAAEFLEAAAARRPEGHWRIRGRSVTGAWGLELLRPRKRGRLEQALSGP